MYYNDKQQVLCEYEYGGATYDYEQQFAFGNYIDEVLWRASIYLVSNKYYGHDHLFSPAVLFHRLGGIQERYEYNAYGEVTIYDDDYSTVRTTSAHDNPYYFTGRRLDLLDPDESDDPQFEIMYYRARYYDPYTGRFLQPDPLGINPAGGQINPFDVFQQYTDGTNVYEYVQSNAISGTDPYGYELYCPTVKDCYIEHKSQQLDNLKDLVVCHKDCGVTFFGMPVCAIACIPAWSGGTWSYAICNVGCDVPVLGIGCLCHYLCNRLVKMYNESSLNALNNCLRIAHDCSP